MSRQIDTSQKLSDEDRQYLIDRNRNAEVTQNDALFGEGDVKDRARASLGMDRVNDGHTGDVDPFSIDDGRDTIAKLNPGSIGLTEGQRQRAEALRAGEDDGTYDAEGQRELQESAVGGPPRVMATTGETVPQPDDGLDGERVTHTDEPEARAGDTGVEGGADLRKEATENAMAQGDPEALERAQDLPGRQISDNYDSLNKEQLREEAERRQLPISGTIPELKARLRAQDRSSA